MAPAAGKGLAREKIMKECITKKEFGAAIKYKGISIVEVLKGHHIISEEKIARTIY